MSDEWYTPPYVFEALGCRFDWDVAHPQDKTFVPCDGTITRDSLSLDWNGFIWMNPPFGSRGSIQKWLEKFFNHGNGVALTPDRTSAPWFHFAISKADAVLLTKGKIKFYKPDGSIGKSPSNGTALWAAGIKANESLVRAERAGLGCLLLPHRTTER